MLLTLVVDHEMLVLEVTLELLFGCLENERAAGMACGVVADVIFDVESFRVPGSFLEAFDFVAQVAVLFVHQDRVALLHVGLGELVEGVVLEVIGLGHGDLLHCLVFFIVALFDFGDV